MIIVTVVTLTVLFAVGSISPLLLSDDTQDIVILER